MDWITMDWVVIIKTYTSWFHRGVSRKVCKLKSR